MSEWIERRPPRAMAVEMTAAVETGLVMAVRQDYPKAALADIQIEWIVFDEHLKRPTVWQPAREEMPEWARNVLVRGRVR